MLILGGGGDDIAYGGGDTDWLEGQNGNDILYGGGGIDVIVADVSPLYTVLGDVIDGHFQNAPDEVVDDDNAVDILLVIGQPIISDRISVGQTAADRMDGRPQGIMHIDYNDRDIFLPWRADPTAPATGTRDRAEPRLPGVRAPQPEF